VVRVSAVISCFNSARYLPGCVGAIRRQDPPVSQIIVVDDHSRDLTSSVATELGCEVLRHDRIRGLSTTRNSGLHAARHELIAFIDADVTLAPGWLAVLLQALRRPGVVIAGGRLIERHHQAPPDRWRARHMIQDHGASARSFDRDQPGRLSGFATLADRATLVAASGYDTRYGRSYEDVDLSRRLIARGHVLAYEPNAVAYHERTDTVRSLMSSCWSWDHWPEYEAGTYRSAWRVTVKLAKNIDQSAQLITWHLADGSYRLVPVDLGIIRFNSWWDARYYLANCRWVPSRVRPRDADLGNLGR
jgi:glycosyltransferase involved in cell wall biosynthesis